MWIKSPGIFINSFTAGKRDGVKLRRARQYISHFSVPSSSQIKINHRADNWRVSLSWWNHVTKRGGGQSESATPTKRRLRLRSSLRHQGWSWREGASVGKTKTRTFVKTREWYPSNRKRKREGHWTPTPWLRSLLSFAPRMKTHRCASFCISTSESQHSVRFLLPRSLTVYISKCCTLGATFLSAYHGECETLEAARERHRRTAKRLSCVLLIWKSKWYEFKYTNNQRANIMKVRDCTSLHGIESALHRAIIFSKTWHRVKIVWISSICGMFFAFQSSFFTQTNLFK